MRGTGKDAYADDDYFQLGEVIEFLSSENGGTWKRGTVVPIVKMFHDELTTPRRRPYSCVYNGMVRIRVSDIVCIIRPIKKCRKVGPS